MASGDGAALYSAAYYGNLQDAERLIRIGTNLNWSNEGGATPLYIAAQNGHKEVVDLLLKHNANINQAAEGGWTPLRIAEHKGHKDIAKKLSEYGMNAKRTQMEMQDATIREFMNLLAKEVPSVAAHLQILRDPTKSIDRAENANTVLGLATKAADVVAANAPSIKTVLESVVTVSGVFAQAMTNLGPFAVGLTLGLQVVALVAKRVHLVKVNTEKCRLAHKRMDQSLPAFEHLRRQLYGSLAELLDSRGVTAAAVNAVKNDFTVLSKPLQAVVEAMQAGKELVEKWTLLNKQKGDRAPRRLVKALKRGIKAGRFRDGFGDWARDYDSAVQALQTAMQTRTFSKVGDLLREVQASGGNAFKAELADAEATDMRRLAADVEDLMAKNKEFKEELGREVADMKEELRTNFSQLFGVLGQEFEALHVRLDKMEGMHAASQSKLDRIQEGIEAMQTGSGGSVRRVEVKIIPYGELIVEEEEKSIGVGSFGEVKKAYWNGKRVAVKVLKGDSIRKRDAKKMEEEARAHCTVAHPNIVTCLGMSVPPNLCIVMEYVYPDLYEAFDDVDDDVLAAGQRWLLALQIAAGMRALHEAGVQHRDLRSPNILLGPKGDRVCRITDFGLSKAKSVFSTLSKAETSPITPHWMAPELMETGEYSQQTDVFSYGIVLYEIATCGDTPLGHLGNDRKTVENVYSSGRLLEKVDKLGRGLDGKYRELMKKCVVPQASKRPSFTYIYTFISHHGTCDKYITF